ncbi:hypothetical protein GCM10022237_37490 [Nocardioides ginsengisoli]|uniref:DUF3515 domain-containing protein n=1 Tax=Nocardioides ginsengisoli TaxID=363868 RepID=A0ABW3VZZ9_9ACTN
MPVPRRRRLAPVAAAIALPFLLSACGGAVEIDLPKLSATDQATCDDFAAELPATLAEQKQVEIEPKSAPAAAYGDPAIIVRCGVPKPKGFGLASSCEQANGVGYYIPDAQYTDQSSDVTLYAAGYRPRVEVSIPAKYRPNAVAAAMSVLAPLIKKHLTLVEACD